MSVLISSGAIQAQGQGFVPQIDEVYEEGVYETGIYGPFVGLTPPTGYTISNLIFEELFVGTSLNAANWNNHMGAEEWGRSFPVGMPAPYSAVDIRNPTVDGFQKQYMNPYPGGYAIDNGAGDCLVVANGELRLIARQNSAFFSSHGYSWAGAAVSGYGKAAVIPAAGGYVQILARLPDMRWGGWPALWLLPEVGGVGAEFDISDGAVNFNITGDDGANRRLFSKWHGAAPEALDTDTGIDLSLGYHLFGLEYRPGSGTAQFKVFLDGALMYTWSGKTSTCAYEVIMTMQIASANAADFYTQTNEAEYPGPLTFSIKGIQIYGLP